MAEGNGPGPTGRDTHSPRSLPRPVGSHLSFPLSLSLARPYSPPPRLLKGTNNSADDRTRKWGVPGEGGEVRVN